VRRKLVPTRAAAQRAISDGRVRVAAVAYPKPSTLVAPDDPVDLLGEPDPYVGRGGRKLEYAIDTFQVPVAGRRAVDVGASTGGFTDCLLQRGAASVVAVDVGYGQIDERLRTDTRVQVVDRTNIRHAEPAALGAPFDLVVADLSFISVGTVAGALAALGGDDSDWLVLVKPQFELGKGRVGKGGVVRDPSLHREAVEAAGTALDDAGIGVVGVVASPIEGAAGNREFLVHAKRGPSAVDAGTVLRAVTGEDET
jgi:23S rRNA (cytidine1920-2'-O)/16S rRNA (cytidine1409-2'-O)-methyltransferase